MSVKYTGFFFDAETRRRRGGTRSLFLLACAAQVAWAAAPVVTELKPRGAEIGRAFTLTAVGRNIDEGAREHDASSFVYAGDAARDAWNDGGGWALGFVSCGIEGGRHAGGISGADRDGVRDFEHPSLHAGNVPGSDGGRIAARVASEPQ